MRSPLRLITLVSLILTLHGGLVPSAARDSGPPAPEVAKPKFSKEKLLGKWLYSGKVGEMSIVGVTEFRKDGTIVAKGKMTFNGETQEVTIEGTWEIKGDVLIETVTKTSNPDLVEKGEVSKDKILSISDTEFFYEDEEGEKITEKRYVEPVDETKSV